MSLQSISNIPGLNKHMLGFLDPSSTLAFQQTSKNLKQVAEKLALEQLKLEVNERIQRVINELEHKQKSTETLLETRDKYLSIIHLCARTVLLTAIVIAVIACALFFGAQMCLGIALGFAILFGIFAGMCIGYYGNRLRTNRIEEREILFDRFKNHNESIKHTIIILNEIKLESNLNNKKSRLNSMNSKVTYINFNDSTIRSSWIHYKSTCWFYGF